jgi:hypothetical protein
MDLEPADLPFRKLPAEEKRDVDALAYCPICRTTEVQIVGTNTSYFNLVAGTNQFGFRVMGVPYFGGKMDHGKNNPEGPWLFGVIVHTPLISEGGG